MAGKSIQTATVILVSGIGLFQPLDNGLVKFHDDDKHRDRKQQPEPRHRRIAHTGAPDSDDAGKHQQTNSHKQSVR